MAYDARDPALGLYTHGIDMADENWGRLNAPALRCCGWAKDCAFGTLSAVALLLTGFFYNALFLGRVLPALGKGLLTIPFGLAFNVAWVLTLCSWLQACLQDAGKIPLHWRDFVSQVQDAIIVAPALRQWQPGIAIFCPDCRIVRPERANHCVICNACRLRMDCHCPFIMNCVGFNNYKFFLLALIYSALTSVIVLITTVQEVLRFSNWLVHLAADSGAEAAIEAFDAAGVSITDACLLLVFCSMALVTGLLLIPLLLLHLPLAAYNQTQLETEYLSGQGMSVAAANPYNLGTAMGNLSQVLGAPGFDWLLPINPTRPVSDGVSFKRGDMDGPNDNEPVDRLWTIRYHVASQHEIGRLFEKGSPCSACQQACRQTCPSNNTSSRR